MPSLISTDNAIAWAQYQLRGGTKSISLAAGGYFVIIIAAIMLTCRLADPREYSNMLTGWTMGLLGLQTLLIVIVGGMRVTNAIRQDITTGIMESHRMMPVPALHAVAGYVLGTLASSTGFFLANVAIGLGTTLISGSPAGRWIGANAVLLLFTIFLWVLFAFAAFAAPKGAGALFGLFPAIGLFSQGAILVVLPGAAVLAGPLLGGTIFSMRNATTQLSSAVLTSAAVQVLMGAIFFAGTMRKYRRPEGLALGVLLSNLLLLMWALCNLLAMLRPEEFRIGFRMPHDMKAPYIGAMISSMLIALVPLANGAREHVAWVKRRLDDPTAKRGTAPPMLALICTAILSLLILAAPEFPGRLDRIMTSAVFIGFSLAIVYLAAWIYLAADNAKMFIGVWLVVFAIMPIVIDVAGNAVSESERAIGILSSFSPWGALVAIGSHAEVDVRAGVIAQMFYWLIPFALYRRRAALVQRTTSAVAVA